MFSIVSTWTGLSILYMNPSIIIARIITAFQKNTNRNFRRDEADRIAVIEGKIVTLEQLIRIQSRTSRLK